MASRRLPGTGGRSTFAPPSSAVDPSNSGASNFASSRSTWPPATPMERARLMATGPARRDKAACTAVSSNFAAISAVIEAFLCLQDDCAVALVLVQAGVDVEYPRAEQDAHVGDVDRCGQFRPVAQRDLVRDRRGHDLRR